MVNSHYSLGPKNTPTTIQDSTATTDTHVMTPESARVPKGSANNMAEVKGLNYLKNLCTNNNQRPQPISNQAEASKTDITDQIATQNYSPIFDSSPELILALYLSNH